MSKKDALVDETGMPVDSEVVETPEDNVDSEDTERSVEEAVTEDATTGEDGNEPAKKGSNKYPKVPKNEGVDPLTAGPKIANPEV
jgi:hypothetical protein